MVTSLEFLLEHGKATKIHSEPMERVLVENELCGSLNLITLSCLEIALLNFISKEEIDELLLVQIFENIRKSRCYETGFTSQHPYQKQQVLKIVFKRHLPSKF